MDVSFLDDETALAWNISRLHPIVVQLGLSLSRYLDGKKPQVKVKQVGPGYMIDCAASALISFTHPLLPYISC